MAHFFEIIFLHHYMDITCQSARSARFKKSDVSQSSDMQQVCPAKSNKADISSPIGRV